MTTYTWIINVMETAPTENGLTDVVKAVQWRLQGNNGTHTTEIYDTLQLSSADPTNFTSYSDLTHDQVVSWIETVLDVNALKAQLDNKLNELSNPPTILKKSPWITERIAGLE